MDLRPEANSRMGTCSKVSFVRSTTRCGVMEMILASTWPVLVGSRTLRNHRYLTEGCWVR